MKSMAWRAAGNVLDDRLEMKMDLVQVGWLAYYKYSEMEPGIRWTAARWAMYRAWKKWRFSEGQANINGSGKTLLKDFAPYLDSYDIEDDFCIEDYAIANQLCSAVERKIKELFRKPELHIKLFKYLIQYGQPNLEKHMLAMLGLTQCRKDKRVKDIRNIIKELYHEKAA